MRLIRVLRLIRGMGVHWIRHEARIHHGNVAEAADVLAAAPGPRFVAHRARKCGACAPQAQTSARPAWGACAPGPVCPNRPVAPRNPMRSQAAGVATIAVSGDLDHVQVGIQAARPGVVFGHGGAELDRLRAELEELTGKPVQLNMMKYDGPPKGRKEIKIGPELTAD